MRHIYVPNTAATPGDSDGTRLSTTAPVSAVPSQQMIAASVRDQPLNGQGNSEGYLPLDSEWEAYTEQGNVTFGTFDLSFHLTPEEYSELLAMKFPTKDADPFEAEQHTNVEV